MSLRQACVGGDVSGDVDVIFVDPDVLIVAISDFTTIEIKEDDLGVVEVGELLMVAIDEDDLTVLEVC